MPSDGLIFYYGAYEHEKGECYPAGIEYRKVPDEHGVRWASDYRYVIKGSFVNQSPELTDQQVGAKVAAMEAAYLEDYEDFGFKYSDGTDTPHKVLTDDALNLSGNKVVNFSWDNTFATEMANTRSFTITLQARFQEAYNEVVSFNERVEKIGDGGPIWRMYNLWNGTPYKEFIHNESKVLHVQTGRIVGLFDWPAAPTPFWPDEEQTWRRRIVQYSPKHFGDLDFDKGRLYVKEYSYFFERNGDTPFIPRYWYP